MLHKERLSNLGLFILEKRRIKTWQTFSGVMTKGKRGYKALVPEELMEESTFPWKQDCKAVQRRVPDSVLSLLDSR